MVVIRKMEVGGRSGFETPLAYLGSARRSRPRENFRGARDQAMAFQAVKEFRCRKYQDVIGDTDEEIVLPDIAVLEQENSDVRAAA